MLFYMKLYNFKIIFKVGILEIITPPKTVDITPVGKNVKITKDGNREILQVVEGVPTRLRCIATDSKPKTDISWTINCKSFKLNIVPLSVSYSIDSLSVVYKLSTLSDIFKYSDFKLTSRKCQLTIV